MNFPMANFEAKEFLGLMLFLGAFANALVGGKGIVKTIELENGDIVDCVDIYQQPAFDHPLLKNHEIQMKPSSFPGVPKGIKAVNYTGKPCYEIWPENEECPEQTIPILRTTQALIDQRPAKKFPPRPRKNQNGVTHSENYEPIAVPGHEYATVWVMDGNYYGAHASMNVWHPRNNPGENSIGQMWIVSGGVTAPINAVEAGWMVDGRPSHSTETRLFVFWTADEYGGTGCYNLECPGFVQVNRRILLGGAIRPVSTYRGQQYEVEITIAKDHLTDNWWMRLHGVDLGYWPSYLFTNGSGLRHKADELSWGGEINNRSPPGQPHTTTQMGSGHFPREGYTRSSYFQHVWPITQPGQKLNGHGFIPYVSKPMCYDLIRGWAETGFHFFFGGPGYSGICQH